MTRSAVCRALLTLALCATAAAPAWSQISNVTGETQTPMPGTGRDYLHSLNETIDPATGALNLSVSVPVPLGRKVTLPFAFTYNSNSAWHLEPASAVGSGPHYEVGIAQLGGWAYQVPSLSRQQQLTYPHPATPSNSPGCSSTTSYIFADPSGGRHAFGIGHLDNYETSYAQSQPPLQGDVNCPGGSPPSTGTDGQYQVALVGGVTSQFNTNPSSDGMPLIVDADGTVYNFGSGWGCGRDASGSHQNYGLPASIEDRNGNLITIATTYGTGSLCSASSFIVKGALGTIITASPFGVTGSTVTISGLTNAYKLTWVSSTPSGLLISHHQLVADSDCAAPPTTAKNLSPSVVSEIELPNGQSYTFSYDSVTGFVNKITYPTGGYVSYTWAVSSLSAATGYADTVGNPGGCQFTYDVPVVTKRIVSFNGTTQALEQDFLYTTTWSSAGPWQWTQKTTTVTTKDLVRNTSYATMYTYRGIIAMGQPGLSLTVASQLPVEQTIQYYPTATVAPPTLKTVTKNWGGYLSNIPMIACETDTIDNVSTSGVFYAYGPGDVVTDKKEYDFGAVTAANCTSDSAPASPLRETTIAYKTFAATPIFASGTTSIFDRPSSIITNGAGTRVAETDYSYDGPAVTSLTGTNAHDDTNYSSSYNVRGNATTVTRQCFPSCTNATTTYMYDQTGQITSKTDPCGNNTCADMVGTNHTTVYSYADSYSSCNGSAPTGNTNAYLTKITDPLGHATSYCYGYNDGQLRGSTDPNNQTTTYAYADALARPTSVLYPDTGQTSYAYNDTAPTPTVTTTKLATPDPTLESISTIDGVGHFTQTQITSISAAVSTSTSYDGLGHVYTVSNPHFAASSPTDGTRTYTIDAIGRTTVLTEQDGSKSTMAYCGSSTLVTDEAGKWRRNVTDGLGRLIEVDEPSSPTSTASSCAASGANITTYLYTALDDLKSVTQINSRPRSFGYDSLSRLTSSSNPESGVISYLYDVDGDIQTRTDARGIVTTYTYDALNRVTQKVYSDGTIQANFAYDASSGWGVSLSNGVGRLTEQWTGTTSNPTATLFSYDPMGRVVLNIWCTPSYCPTATSSRFSSTYTYDLAGGLTAFSNGLGVTFSYSLDGAGRTTKMTGINNPPQYPATLATIDPTVGFWPTGTIRKVTLGNGLTQTSVYSNRSQPCRLNVNSSGTALGTCTDAIPSGNVQDFSYALNYGSTDNGNVTAWTATGQQTFTRSYAYDQLNRLSTMSDSATNQACKGLAWVYDAWGNRTAQNVTSGTCPAPQTPVNANNQVSTSGYTYDASGNMTHDANHSYTYDAENRLTKVDGGSTATYIYDAVGRRMEKTTSAGYVDYLYDLAGNVTGEWNTVPNAHYGYMNGQLVAEYIAGTTYFIHKDHLGSTRLITGVTQSIVDNMDYLPYGEQIAGGNSITHKFTGKERDSESGLDDFGARYNASSIGRFTSPDPLSGSASLSNPQTWNRYPYALNNPLRITDPTGLWDWDESAGGDASDEDLEERANDSELSRKERNLAKQALAFRQQFRDALDAANEAAGSSRLSDDQQSDAQAAVNSYGSENDGNGVTVGKEAGYGADTLLNDDDTISVKFGSNVKGDFLTATVAHEGAHVDQAQTWLSLGGVQGSIGDLNHYAREQAAWTVGASVAQALGMKSYAPHGGGSEYQVWNKGWKAADVQTLQSKGIANILNFSNLKPNDTDTYSNEHH